MSRNIDYLFPKKINPYYIVTPPYTRFSAGIKALHLLSHSLNLRNIPSYIIPFGESDLKWRNDITETDLLTPILTQRTARKHYESKQTPIFIYPDIISENPLGSECNVRFMLNFPGAISGCLLYTSDAADE